MAKKIEINPLVCAKNECTSCGIGVINVPKKCKYAILHCLETEKFSGCIEQMGRQTGKTTRLIRMASSLKDLGVPVYFVTRTRAMIDYIGHMRMQTENIRFLSMGQVRAGVCIPGYIFTDELTPDEAVELERYMSGSRLLGGYYTAGG